MVVLFLTIVYYLVPLVSQTIFKPDLEACKHVEKT